MRRVRYVLIIALMVINIAASLIKAGGQSKEQIPTVPFCDLTEHPEKYAGKMVRIKASYVSWWESSYIYHLDCEDAEHKIHDGLDCSEETECRELSKKVYGYINKHQRLDKNNYASRAYVILIGRLEGPSEIGYGHLNGFKFEFRIREVESAKPMPSDLPYKN